MCIESILGLQKLCTMLTLELCLLVNAFMRQAFTFTSKALITKLASIPCISRVGYDFVLCPFSPFLECQIAQGTLKLHIAVFRSYMICEITPLSESLVTLVTVVI